MAPRAALTGTLARWRVAALVPFALAAIACSCVVLAIEPWPVGVFQDDGIYTVLARSLASGEGYRYLQMPGAPNATHYPPGYPAFLAVLWKLGPEFPRNVTLFKFANAALVGLAAVLAYRFATSRARLSSAAAAVGVGLFTACSPVVLLAVMVMSEPLFMVGLIPALVATERATESGRVRDAALAGVAGGLLAMVRTLGALIVPAAVIALLLKRRWRPAAVVAGAGILTMLPWQLWVAAHAAEVPAIFLGKYGSYTGWFADAVRAEGLQWIGRLVRFNLRMLAFETWTHTGTVLLPLSLRVIAMVGAGGLLVLGLVRAFTVIRATAIFVVLYLGIVIVWPFAPARFLWGIWPLIGVFCALGAVSAIAWGARAGGVVRRVAPIIAVSLLIVGYLRFNVQSTAEHWWTRVQGSVAARAKPMAEWVLANTDSNAVLATDDDLLIYLYTGRRSIPNGTFTPQEHMVPQTPAFAVSNLRSILRSYDVDYVLVSTEYATYAARGLLSARPPELQLIAPLSRGAVFAPIRRERER